MERESDKKRNVRKMFNSNAIRRTGRLHLIELSFVILSFEFDFVFSITQKTIVIINLKNFIFHIAVMRTYSDVIKSFCWECARRCYGWQDIKRAL